MRALFTSLARFKVRSSADGLGVFLLALLAFIVWPHDAFAQITLGNVFCNVFDNMGPFVTLMNGIAYVSGGIMLGQGILLLKQHTEDSRSNPFHKAAARLGAGGALLVVPYFAEKLVRTFFFSSGGGGLSSCVAFNAGGAGIGTGAGLDVLITNLVSNIKQPMISFLSLTAILMGVFFLVKGLHRAAKYGQDPKTHSVPNIATHIVIGTILIVVGQSLETMLTTLFGDPNVTSSAILSWATLDALTGGVSPQFKIAVLASLTFFQLVGMIAFLRGWLIVKNAIEGSGQATLAQGFTHIMGGVLAINIYAVISMFDSTFGTYLFS